LITSFIFYYYIKKFETKSTSIFSVKKGHINI
ncbi:MAG: hypothetical protein ACJAVD_000503, partial [Porticoccaceae bacterium]